MRLLRLLFYENMDKFAYFLHEEEQAKYWKLKLICACIPLCGLGIMVVRGSFHQVVWLPFFMYAGYKVPYFMLSMRHTQNCNEVVAAIPLWVNQLYALIEKNTIHNAIVNSLDKHTPAAIGQDLTYLIEQITLHPDNKDAYIGFLARYQIEGFMDIMLKLYEFRSLSKEKLKYEMRHLNESLGKIEAMKRQNRFRNEVFFGDTCTCFILFIPCVYLTLISLMPSLFTV